MLATALSMGAVDGCNVAQIGCNSTTKWRFNSTLQVGGGERGKWTAVVTCKMQQGIMGVVAAAPTLRSHTPTQTHTNPHEQYCLYGSALGSSSALLSTLMLIVSRPSRTAPTMRRKRSVPANDAKGLRPYRLTGPYLRAPGGEGSSVTGCQGIAGEG